MSFSATHWFIYTVYKYTDVYMDVLYIYLYSTLVWCPVMTVHQVRSDIMDAFPLIRTVLSAICKLWSINVAKIQQSDLLGLLLVEAFLSLRGNSIAAITFDIFDHKVFVITRHKIHQVHPDHPFLNCIIMAYVSF